MVAEQTCSPLLVCNGGNKFDPLACFTHFLPEVKVAFASQLWPKISGIRPDSGNCLGLRRP